MSENRPVPRIGHKPGTRPTDRRINTRWRLGLGFVLLFWLVLSGLAALFGACVLVIPVYWIQRRRRSIRARWILGALALPFASVAYMWAIFAVYAVYCEAIRDVDLGIGESWRVPLTHGYTLTMIDTPDRAFVRLPSGAQHHHGLTRVSATEHFVTVEDEGRFFLMDVRGGRESVFLTEAELRAALQGSGETTVELLSPSDYYDAHRWRALDAIAATLALAPPGLAFLTFVFGFARAQRRIVDSSRVDTRTG